MKMVHLSAAGQLLPICRALEICSRAPLYLAEVNALEGALSFPNCKVNSDLGC